MLEDDVKVRRVQDVRHTGVGSEPVWKDTGLREVLEEEDGPCPLALDILQENSKGH